MANDVIMPLNPLIVLVEDEKFEETLLNINVSQRSHEEKPFKKVVHTRLNRSTWDCQLSPNPHALIIYLKFIPTCEVAPKRFEEC